MPTVALRSSITFCGPSRPPEIVNEASCRLKEYFDRAEPCSDSGSTGRSRCLSSVKTDNTLIEQKNFSLNRKSRRLRLYGYTPSRRGRHT